MKIKRITKKKSNSYELLFDNNTKIILYDDTIIKYGLISKKDIDNKLFVEISSYNKEIEGYYTAIKLINTKLRTKEEIKNKLTKLGCNNIDGIINRLTKEGYLNDSLYIKCYINDAINLSLKGPNKIKMELNKMKLSSNIINDYLDSFDTDIWFDRVNKIIDKKIKSNHNLSNIIFKKKLNSYLVSMGYEKELVTEALSNVIMDSDNDILKKELDKELKKISRKYEGIELKNKVKYNLYKKGFSLDDIEKLLCK